MKPAYARLHIMLARESPVGLVIRHGTAKSVCTLLWNRKTDKFSLGQWMRGRIDTDTCDLSPDGVHFLYSARKYGLVKASKHVDAIGETVAWTVVSRTPYLKAVAYYPSVRDGGWFLNSFEYCVPWSGGSHPHYRESPEVRRVLAEAPKPSLYAARLVRGGWAIDVSPTRLVRRTEFVKSAGTGWDLRYTPPRGYRLVRGEVEEKLNGWDWARLNLARQDRLGRRVLIHDRSNWWS